MSEMGDSVQQARASDEYRIAKEQMASRDWRVQNLYWIQDKDGNEVLYKHKAAQKAYYDSQWYRDALAKARQIGFSTEISLLIFDDCLFRRNTRAAIIDATLSDAKKKLAKIKFAYERLPRVIRKTVPLLKDNTEHIKFANGSEISVGTSYRGDTPQILHVSEYGKISVDRPDVAKEIRNGAFNAVGKHGKIYVEATAHGTSGEYYDLIERAKAKKASGQPLTPLDFKLHFYGWWMDPEYRLPANSVLVTAELHLYFTELQVKYGIKLDAEQKAWYAKMYEEQGPDDMKSEYPSHIGECFFNSLKGTFFKTELNRARADKRIGERLPFDPSRTVNTFWDIGMDDENVIWFHQTDGVRHRMIDFYRNSGEGLPHYISIIRQKQEQRGFVYGKHYGPHDLEVREWTSQSAKPRKDIAADLGLKFTVVPKIDDKADAIEAARRFIQTCWFDHEHCSKGVEGLENYRKKWNKTISAWSSDPVHDWASHIADALMTGAVGLVPDRIKRQRSHTHDSVKTGPSHWSN
jgi:hypothetical protein